MKKVFFIVLVLTACATESTVGPASSSTFVRYFNGGNSDESQALLETTDKGLLILASTEITPTDPTILPHSKIKLIKTDAFGNLLWQKLYPDFQDETGVGGTTLSYRGKGITALAAGGYVIVGEEIKGGRSKLLIISVDNDGTILAKRTVNSPNERKGVSVAENKAGNYVVLGSIPGLSNNNMMLTEFAKATLDSLWTRDYGAGEIINLTNKLFLDNQDIAYWSGSVRKQNTPNPLTRFVKAPLNSPLTTFDDSPASQFTETFNDMLSLGAGAFAMAGKSNSTKNNSTGSFNISYKKVIGTTALINQTYPIKDQDGDANGNSLCLAHDGGFVLLGTSKISGATGRGETDYCLVKIDGFGVPIWTKTYGSKFEDVGVSIITTSDGGHVILGTTNLANIKTILLMKTDQQGNIQ